MEIENGNFDHKKTASEKVLELVAARQHTSCMNNTKWREFLHAMTEEMSVKVPYTYKTVFESDDADMWESINYDIENFNNYYFKSLEWVKVYPKFGEYEHRGRLLEPEKFLLM